MFSANGRFFWVQNYVFVKSMCGSFWSMQKYPKVATLPENIFSNIWKYHNLSGSWPIFTEGLVKKKCGILVKTYSVFFKKNYCETALTTQFLVLFSWAIVVQSEEVIFKAASIAEWRRHQWKFWFEGKAIICYWGSQYVLAYIIRYLIYTS